jgi:hypothetical protein
MRPFELSLGENAGGEVAPGAQFWRVAGRYREGPLVFPRPPVASASHTPATSPTHDRDRTHGTFHRGTGKGRIPGLNGGRQDATLSYFTMTWLILRPDCSVYQHHKLHGARPPPRVEASSRYFISTASFTRAMLNNFFRPSSPRPPPRRESEHAERQ